MSYFEAKMHQISISAGALPQTPLKELTGDKGERGRGLEPPPLQISGYATACDKTCNKFCKTCTRLAALISRGVAKNLFFFGGGGIKVFWGRPYKTVE